MWTPNSVGTFLARQFPPCKEVTRLVSESLDRDLSVPERLTLRVHVLMCVLCRRFARQVRFVRDALRRHPDRLEGQVLPPPPGLSTEARDRIRRSLTRS